MIERGRQLDFNNGTYGKITEIFALGFNYHTFDSGGNCIKGERYMLKDDYKWKWKMDFCKKNGLAPAQTFAWDRAEREYNTAGKMST